MEVMGLGSLCRTNLVCWIRKRIWERQFSGQPVRTYYAYDDDTGQLMDISYSDGTPGVSFTYDRLGRPITVTDGVGTHTLTYNDALQFESEALAGLYDKVVTTEYEDATGLPGRFNGISVGTLADPKADYQAGYLYDADGRMQRVLGPGLLGYGAKYSYLADSDLVEHVDHMVDETTVEGSTTWGYEANRDLVASVENRWPSPV
ncbi:MAG: hypothetical protein KJ563_02360, partial [Candidatus Thermoplasmatota archaeon]|nr:hypothetical protein [Candidatus Thermoplasmatota archaeon]